MFLGATRTPRRRWMNNHRHWLSVCVCVCVCVCVFIDMYVFVCGNIRMHDAITFDIHVLSWLADPLGSLAVDNTTTPASIIQRHRVPYPSVYTGAHTSLIMAINDNHRMNMIPSYHCRFRRSITGNETHRVPSLQTAADGLLSTQMRWWPLIKYQ